MDGDKKTDEGKEDSAEPEEDGKAGGPIKPVDKKIGEGRDNLRRRREWYRRRTGRSG